MKRILLALCALPLFACAHNAAPAGEQRTISLSDVRSLELCRTTETELRNKFGTPTRDGVIHRQRVLSWLTETEPLERYLAVVIDERGVVVDLYWDIPTEVPWQPVNQCIGAP